VNLYTTTSSKIRNVVKFVSRLYRIRYDVNNSASEAYMYTIYTRKNICWFYTQTLQNCYSIDGLSSVLHIKVRAYLSCMYSIFWFIRKYDNVFYISIRVVWYHRKLVKSMQQLGCSIQNRI